MANTQSMNVILRKKLNSIVYDLMVKSTADLIYVDDTTTLKSKLTEIGNSLNQYVEYMNTLTGSTAPTKAIQTQINEAITTEINKLTNESDATSLAGKISALNTAIQAINNATTGILAQAKGYTDDKLGISETSFTTMKDYVDNIKQEINASVASAFNFKGTVDYADQLPTENNESGDVYQVKYAGNAAAAGTTALNAEFCYNGTEFVELGSIIDLSNYYTKKQVDDAIKKATDELSETITANAARILYSETEPADLTENDIWIAPIAATPAG